MTALADPDLAVTLRLDPYAPRAARHHVALVDRPSPDLRDAVMLLTSELVTRAVQQSELRSEEAVEMRVWMPRETVRVELRGEQRLLCDPPNHRVGYELLLLESLADRWSIERDQEQACMWFEIDRQASREATDAASSQARPPHIPVA